MSVLGLRILALSAGLLAGRPAPVDAQGTPSTPNIDSLTSVLDTPNLGDRSMAVAALSAVPPLSLPGATRSKLVALLEREATSPRPPKADDGEDSEWGLYMIELVRLAVRLQDPSATHALALVGLTVSADAQRFVASRGEAAIPMLDEAEHADASIVDAVAATRGRMIGDYGDALSLASRTMLRRKIIDIAARDPLAFARAARFGRMVEMTPLLADMATNASSAFRRAVLTDAAQQLAVARTQTPPADILLSLSASLAAMCDGAVDSRFGACQEMQHVLGQASDEVRASRPTVARRLLAVLAKDADEAARQGRITASERTMVAGTATYLATRV